MSVFSIVAFHGVYGLFSSRLLKKEGQSPLSQAPVYHEFVTAYVVPARSQPPTDVLAQLDGARPGSDRSMPENARAVTRQPWSER